MSKLTLGRLPLKRRKRRPEDAIAHSVNHWIRVEALAIFHEGEFSTGEVADMIREDVKNVRPHIRDLYDSGSIEFAGYKIVGNHRVPIYRAVILPMVTPEVYASMSIEDRHDLNQAVVQGVLAETVAAYRAGKMDVDEDLYLVWDAPSVDAIGRKELHAELADSLERIKTVHSRSADRMAKSGETGTTVVVGLLGFERSRPGRPAGGYFAKEKNER